MAVIKKTKAIKNYPKHLLGIQNLSFSEALQETINEMIDQNQHPLMWAPFILIGDR